MGSLRNIYVMEVGVVEVLVPSNKDMLLGSILSSYCLTTVLIVSPVDTMSLMNWNCMDI